MPNTLFSNLSKYSDASWSKVVVLYTTNGLGPILLGGAVKRMIDICNFKLNSYVGFRELVTYFTWLYFSLLPADPGMRTNCSIIELKFNNNNNII